MPKFEIRAAGKSDVAILLELIRGIAEYEKMTDELVATEELLSEWLFEKRVAEALLAFEDGEPVGYALFFPLFSTFAGRGGLYLEDLFVLPDRRGRGYGKALFKTLAAIAVERNYCRVEWRCLDWNQPSIDFYHSLGAVALDEWTTFRLAGENIEALARS